MLFNHPIIAGNCTHAKTKGTGGAACQCGEALFFDKNRPDVIYVAPVSGELIAINRGERRAIQELVILADKTIQYRSSRQNSTLDSSREALVAFLLESGAWPLIRQRPYNVLADQNEVPRDIFISTFDTAPLAPDLNLVVSRQKLLFKRPGCTGAIDQWESIPGP
ncbi:MAG: hypothetical protein IPO07_17810 [Haliscomenobacter sp.]|nr:hypothetical protein [Haliscomenobacter sp.]MBK9490426.1 hypothetical protein [Haliscomenobacter sp.]